MKSVNNAIRLSAQGLSMMMILKFTLKIFQIFLNFLIISDIDPGVYGLNLYFLSLNKLQTFITEDCFRETYQKRIIDKDNSGGKGNREDKDILTASRNLMIFGVYITAIVGVISAAGYILVFGHKHPYFSHAVIGYTLGSLFSAYTFKINVDHQLSFSFEVFVVAEGIGFTVNTLLQTALIKGLGMDPVLTFGVTNAASNFSKIIVFVYYSWYRKANPSDQYDLSLSLQPLSLQGDTESRYLLPNTLSFAWKLAYNTLLVDFFDQLYFIIFVKDDKLIGELTLIRSFGNLMIRFLYAPVGDITYNLYAKMIVESRKSITPEEKTTIITKMVRIVQGVVFIFAFLNYFIFAYGLYTADTALLLCFGNKWVDKAFVRAFLVYIPVMFFVGAVGHTESFAKALFDDSSMVQYNYLNSVWLVAYFFILQICQRMGTSGIFIAYIIFLSVRTGIATYLVEKMNIGITQKSLFIGAMPKKIEMGLFAGGMLVSRILMHMNPGVNGLVMVSMGAFCHLYAQYKLRTPYLSALSTLITPRPSPA